MEIAIPNIKLFDLSSTEMLFFPDFKCHILRNMSLY